MAKRLNVYTEWLQRLDVGLSRQNLETAIIKLYAHILSFLAEAIRTYQTSSIRRVLSSVWTESSFITFEKTVNELAQHVETEASNCDRVTYSRDVLSVLNELQQSRRLQIKSDLETKLDKIPWASGAIFNSYDSIHRLCHPQTRIDVLDQIRGWIRDRDSKTIFWLSGPAGTGKSTISWTIANELTNQSGQPNPSSQVGIVLGASFFFKRGEGDRGSSYRFFSTIIRQLVVNIPEIDHLVAKAIHSDPFIFDKDLSEQFDKLILAPLTTITSTFVVVVDALDECDNENHIRIILRLWSLLPRARLKLFLTSRPETPIRLQFSAMTECYQHLKLELSLNLQQDLAIYIRDEFRQIQAEHPDLSGHDWISQETINRLVHLSDPLFIIAATICRFVGDPSWDPQDRLNEIFHRSTGQLSQIERTYLPVIDSLVAKSRDSDDKKILMQQFHTVIGSIVCLVEPLSISSLATLINISPRLVTRRLDPLHSVLSVPSDDSPVRTLHLSFQEFLLARGDQNEPFGIHAPAIHSTLKNHCLRLLSDSLRTNLLDLNPGDFRQDIEPRVLETLCPAFRYACRYWVHHHKEAHIQIEDNDLVYVFLQKHFLHWLEALSLIDCLAEAISFLEILSSSASPKVLLFLDDARRFILANRYIIDLAPYQVYISASVFAPQMSKMRALCQVPGWLLRYPDAPMFWGPEIQKLQGHSSGVSVVTFSADGSLLASGSLDETVRLWDAKTGREMQTFSHSEIVQMVAFSPNGFILFSATFDGIIHCWDIHVGQEVRNFKLDGKIIEATLSSDGCLIALVVDYNMIDLWNIETGQKVRTIGGDDEEVYSIAFSPDNSLLASASGRKSEIVRVWNIRTGQQIRMIPQTSGINCVEFSPNGSLLALGTDNGILIWDTKTWQKVQSLQYDLGLFATTFSLGGSLLVSGTKSGIIYTWDTQTWQKVQTLVGHNQDINSLSFSRDGSLASGSGDSTIRLWNVRTDQDIQNSEKRTETSSDQGVKDIAFSPDGSILAVSASSGLCLYNAQTGQVLRTEPASPSSPITFSPDGYLVAFKLDSAIHLWNPKTEQRTQLEGDLGDASLIAFSPKGSLFASRLSDGTIRIWDVTSGHEMSDFSLESEIGVNAIAFSPDGSLLALGLTDYAIILLDVVKFELRDSLVVDPKRSVTLITAITISHSGNLLAVGLSHGQISLLEINTGQEVRIIQNMPHVGKIEFAQDDQSLITSGGVIALGSDSSVNFESTNNYGHWIQSGNTNLVWLPQEYRGHKIAFHDGLVAISQHSGAIGFWKLASSFKWHEPPRRHRDRIERITYGSANGGTGTQDYEWKESSDIGSKEAASVLANTGAVSGSRGIPIWISGSDSRRPRFVRVNSHGELEL